MVIKVPHYHEFPESLTKKVLEKTDCSVPVWEISVPRRDDIAWSIVLSYLIATNFRKETEFAERLKALTGSDKNAKLVKKSIRYFNPFRNRFSCFFDEDLKQVVQDFKSNLNWEQLLRVSDKLSVASKSLNCPIFLINYDPEGEKYEIYPKNVKMCEDMITLMSSSGISAEDNETNLTIVYNFMIIGPLGSKLKAAALLYFLKEVNVSKKEIKKIKSDDGKENNFLKSLLESGCRDTLVKLYKSPYIVSKISEAGYKTDPRTKDTEGLSALHHALNLGNFNMFAELYFFSVNSCSQLEASYRNPNSSIVTNLLQMEEILSDDLSKIKHFKHHQKNSEWVQAFEDLLKFNRFLIEINKKIVNIKNKINYYETVEDSVFDASKRRDVIVSLLDTYTEFFNPTGQENPPPSPLEDYVLHRNYCNLIDMATSIIFFDNIILLKERLDLKKENQFSEIESSFYISILFHIYFEEAIHKEYTKKRNYRKKRNYANPSFQSNLRNISLFTLIERLDNFDKVKEFSKDLRDTVISVENVVQRMPKREITNIFHPYPEIKSSFHLERLKHYIKIALNVRITDVQSVVVIEHVLQVIGEYVLPGKYNNFVGRLLSLYLPREITITLRRVRDDLSHLKGYAFPAKFECEKNLSLFRSIQREIFEIENHFKIVYHIFKLSNKIFLKKHMEEKRERIKKSTHLHANASLQFAIHSKKDETGDVENYLYNAFWKSRHFYLYFFDVVLHRLKDEIIGEIFKKNCEFEEIINQVKCALHPLKWLLDLAQQCNAWSCVGNLLDTFQALQNCNTENSTIEDFKEKANNFITKCKEFLSALTASKQKGRKSLKSIQNIEYFLKILRGFDFLSTEEKDKIREEIPPVIKQSILVKEKLIESVENGFSLNVCKNSSDFQISYLSNKKKNSLQKLYLNKDHHVLDVLNTPDPVEILEDIFSKNSADKKKYDALCEDMEFSEATRQKLGKLVAGQRKKIPGNDLSCLLNRVQLLKKILIGENEKISYLWIKIKSPNSRQLLFDKIVQQYLKDQQQQVAIDMLLFDCMILFKTPPEKYPWIKSSKLYSGINLRNVISHGSPLLESLCTLIDPEDLPSEKIKQIIQLIDEEDVIKSILELYELKKDFTEVLKLIHSEEEDEYGDLRDLIKKCDKWMTYVSLLPYNVEKVDFKK